MSNDTGQFIKIPLSKQGKYAGMYEAIVSPEDADLTNLRWSACISEGGKRVYAQRTSPSKMLNRVIMERMIGRKLNRSEYVDHINNNPLDNRRVNLRVVTNQQNSWNARSCLGATKYRGVSYHKSTGSYRARIHIDGEEIHLGLYETAEEAYEVYCEVAKERFGNYANLDYSEATPDNRLGTRDVTRARQRTTLDGVFIPLSKNGKHAGQYEVVVDMQDSDLAEYNWSIHGAHNSKKTVYAVGRYKSKNRNTLIHTIVMERILKRKMKPEECVDHIDGDGLNNRRSNLRIATITQNNWNVGTYSHNTTGYKGVSKKRQKFRASISVNSKTKHLGTFDTPEEAHEAYCEAVEKYRGKFGNAG